jgi:WhiB family redox-sensing transcriptional regulator
MAKNEDWRLSAACLPIELDLFFPVSSTGASLEQVSKAKAICACCLVRRQCLAFALRTRQVYGIWGGLGEDERAREVRYQRADRDAVDPPASA